jgi:hypothetical protein
LQATTTCHLTSCNYKLKYKNQDHTISYSSEITVEPIKKGVKDFNPIKFKLNISAADAISSRSITLGTGKEG